MKETGTGGLQSQIAKLLDQLGIVYIRSRSDKRATNTPGTPDFIFSVSCYEQVGENRWIYDQACAFEVKLPKKKLRPDQEKMRERMTKSPNAWRYAVITSLDEAIAELKAMGLIC